MFDRTRRARSLPIALLLAGSLLAGCETDRPTEIVRMSGDRSFQLGAYDEAATEYREITTRYPGDWRAQLQLGICCIELERWHEASVALKVALDQRPEDEEIADALADAYAGAEDYPELFAFLRQRAESRQSARAWMRLAEHAMRASDPDTAMIAIDTAIALDLDAPEGPTKAPYLLAANLAEGLGDLTTASRRLRQAYQIDPRDREIAERLRALGEIPGPTIGLPPGR